MEETPMARLSRAWATRNDRPRRCEYGMLTGHRETCENVITLRESERAGHRGYCSPEHSYWAQHEQLL